MPDLNAYRELRAASEQEGATLVAVSKRKSVADIRALYEAGHRDFGENYVQELAEKQPELPKDIRWHFIGSLQRNKVKQIVPFVHLVHGIDSLRLAAEIDKRGRAVGRIVDVLFQVDVTDEDTKHGFTPAELNKLLAGDEVHRLAWVRPCGIMGMASHTDDQDRLSTEFERLRKTFDTLGERYYARRPEWSTLSMGMSGDYELALTHGSTMIRVGSLLFGARD